METAEVIIPVETDSSNSVPKEEVNRKSLNQLDSQPFIANLETCVVDEKEVLKAGEIILLLIFTKHKNCWQFFEAVKY